MNAALKHQIIEQIIRSDDDEILSEIALMLEIESNAFCEKIPDRFKTAINQSKQQFDNTESILSRPLINRNRSQFVKA